jgi:hypothetical protein
MMFQHIGLNRNCPVCKSAEVYRVKRTGLPLRVLCGLLNLRPYWCQECDTFFLGPRQSKPSLIEQAKGPASSETPGADPPPASGAPH